MNSTRQARHRVAQLIIIGLLLAASPAFGQRTVRSILGSGQHLEPEFLRRDVQLFVTDLGMDDGQKAIFETIYTDYESRFAEAVQQHRQQQAGLSAVEPLSTSERHTREAGLQREIQALVEEARTIRRKNTPGAQARQEEIRARMIEIQEEIGRLNPRQEDFEDLGTVIEPILTLREQWLDRRQMMRDQFVDETRAIVNDEQWQLWPALERKLRRQKTLPKGQLSGERVNLFSVVRAMELSNEEQALVLPALNEYDVELDRALAARNEYILRAEVQEARALTEQSHSMLQSIMAEQANLRVAVRDVHQEYAMVMEAALPEHLATTFRGVFQMQAYPRIFNPTRLERSLTAASAMQGITAAQREGIEALRATVTTDLAALNQRILDATRSEEPGFMMQRYAHMAGSDPTQKPEQPVSAMAQGFQERQELLQEGFVQLRAVLGDGRYDQVPGVVLSHELDARRRDKQLIDSGEDFPPELAARFDRDGDGQLSREEREALVKAMRQQRERTERIRQQQQQSDDG